jgi:Zn-dependent peptidase ImmA (M78 family)
MVVTNAITVEKGERSETLGYGRTVIEAERDAQELLTRAWRKSGPSGPLLPVDPFEIALDLGLRVFTGRGMSPDISGTLTKAAGYEDPKIVLNALDSRNRQRFTCAHELGHYTLQVKNGGPGPWELEDGRDLLDESRLDPDEAYANHFAAELLMPREVVLEKIPGSNAAALALDFGVAGDAIRFRLDNLGPK